MRPALTSYLFVAAVAGGVTLVTVPLFIRLSMRFGLMVDPDARRLHEKPTASIGGGAMYVGFVVAFFAAWLSGTFDAAFDGSTEPWAILAGATLAYGVGVLDDVRELSAPAKIAGMLVTAAALAAGGVSIIWFRIPFWDVFILPYDLAFLATVVWVLGMANAVNFIDGLDGLAAGIVGIGATAFLLYGIRLGQVELLLAGNVGPLVAAMVLGICVGFLPWNVYPARIFMGDGGSLLLGTLMAASTMSVGGRTPDAFSGQTFFFYAPLVIPLVILGVPVLDTAFAILRRAPAAEGVSPRPTRTIFTIGSFGWGTAIVAACGFCGPGPHCCRRSCSTRRTTRVRVTPSSPWGSGPPPWCCSRSSCPVCVRGEPPVGQPNSRRIAHRPPWARARRRPLRATVQVAGSRRRSRSQRRS